MAKTPKRKQIDASKDWRTLFDTKYLGHQDLKIMNNGNPIVLTIKGVVKEEVKNREGADWCNLALFEEAEYKGHKVKPMILNKTNFRNLEDGFKTNVTKNFYGKKVQIYIINNQWNASEQGYTDALRLRVPELKEDKVRNFTPEERQRLANGFSQGNSFEELEGLIDFPIPEEERNKILAISKKNKKNKDNE